MRKFLMLQSGGPDKMADKAAKNIYQ